MAKVVIDDEVVMMSSGQVVIDDEVVIDQKIIDWREISVISQ